NLQAFLAQSVLRFQGTVGLPVALDQGAGLDLASTSFEQRQRSLGAYFADQVDRLTLRWRRRVSNSQDRRLDLLVVRGLLFGLRIVRIKPNVDARSSLHRAISFVDSRVEMAALDLAFHRLRVVLRAHVFELLNLALVCSHLILCVEDWQATVNCHPDLGDRSL